MRAVIGYAQVVAEVYVVGDAQTLRQLGPGLRNDGHSASANFAKMPSSVLMEIRKDGEGRASSGKWRKQVREKVCAYFNPL